MLCGGESAAFIEPKGQEPAPPHNPSRHIYGDMWRVTYPFGGDLYVFRGKNGKLIKILWHDGLGMSLYAKRLERGRFVWPQASDGAVTITPAQLGYLLEGIDWRHPQHSWRPSAAG